MLSTAVLVVVLTQAPEPLRWEPRADIPISGALTAGWLLSEFAFKKELAAPRCRWCVTNGFDTAVRSVFNPGLTPSAQGIAGPDLASNLIGFVGVPLVALGLDGLLAWKAGAFWETYPIDFLLIVEAMLVAQGINQSIKFAAARGRPYTVGASPELLAQAKDVNDHNLSFFSGHSSFVFALVAGAANVAELRGYRHSWLIWAVGLPLAAATAVLRVAADKHWTSDVLLGTAVGMATGVLVPRLLHSRLGPVNLRLTPMGNGLGVAGQF